MGGSGNPWGPMTTGMPETPVYETFESDPSRVQGFNTSDLKRALDREIALRGGGAQDQYLAGASKAMGGYGTQSSDFARRLSEIASETAAGKNKVAADLAMQEWQSRLNQMEAMNRAREARNRLLQGRYQTDKEAFDREQEQRAQFNQAIAQTVGSVVGGLAG